VKIRKAGLNDRQVWDSFVDNEGGSIYHYYDWKRIYEARGQEFIQLIIETDSSGLIGIFPIVKEKRRFSSIIRSPDGASTGFLLKRELSGIERNDIIRSLMKYVDSNYSKGCSTFLLKENLMFSSIQNDEPTTALIGNGFRARFDKSTRLPCNYILELKQPFEQCIWKGLWEHTLRRQINKLTKSNIVVIEDKDLKYRESFIDMVSANYKRHRNKLPQRDDIVRQLDIFRDKSKLFVALIKDQPVVSLLCFYSLSTCYLSLIGSYVKETQNINKLCEKTAIEDACNKGYKFADFGATYTPGEAFFKEYFKATPVPLRQYEKIYSPSRALLEQVPILIKMVWHDKNYIRHNWHRLLDRITHR
jgi:hypothetical protein